MSELIDRIFDTEKISAEVAQILAEVGRAVEGIKGYKTAIEDIEKAVRKSKGTDELAKNTQSLNDAVVKGGVEMKRYEAEVQKLNEKTAQLTTTEKAAAIEIAKARLELQAAQKATKEAALAEIELTAQNKNLAGSYNALDKDLKNAIKSYKALSEEERNGAKGKELLAKIQETQSSLKKTDAAMGNYQRNVGNYGSLLDGLTPKLGGLAGKLMEISEAAKKNKKDWDGLDNSANSGIQTMGTAPKGLSTIVAGFKGLGQTIAAVGKAILANPIGIVIAAIVGAFALMKQAVDSNGEATRKLGQVLAPFKAILGAVMQVISGLVSTLLDGVLAFGNLANAIMSFIPGLDKVAAKNREAIALEREKQKLIREGILDKAADAKEELRISELKKKIMDSDTYSKKERLAMAKEIDRAEKAMAIDDANRANKNLKDFLKDMKLKGKAQKDYTEDEWKQFADLQAAKYSEQQKYYDKTTKLESKSSKLSDAIRAEEQKAKDDAAAAEKERNEKILASRRRLIDSGLSLMKEGKDKEIALSNEAYKREIEDLKSNGELTTQLAKNLKQKQAEELKKIDNDWKAKDLNDSIKADELKLDNMKRAGDDTLAFEKKLLEKRKEAEILAGADREETNKKYAFLELDLIAKNSDEKAVLFAKEIEKQSETLKIGYEKQALELKKQYAKGKISKEQYESDLVNLTSESQREINEQTISMMQTQLDSAQLTAEKRAELSKKLADLQIANENAVTDASIKAGEDQLAADKEAAEKRMALAQEIAGVTMEVFGAIANFQKGQSEARIQELEAEQERSDEAFAKEQEQLDGAIMSDEARAEKQKQLNEKKAAADKAIQDKIKAEKIKQAKWEKAQAIIGAIISTALAVMKVFEQTGIFGIIASSLVAATGAIQIATIASQPLPAFEHGGTTEGGAVLWGEKRAEVAVTPSGETFLADRPTVTEFDAGTRIYKSVSDYENSMSSTGGAGFQFDYDKMGEKMKAPSIVLDSRGLWGIVSQQNSRRLMINRRYTL